MKISFDNSGGVTLHHEGFYMHFSGEKELKVCAKIIRDFLDGSYIHKIYFWDGRDPDYATATNPQLFEIKKLYKQSLCDNDIMLLLSQDINKGTDHETYGVHLCAATRISQAI